MNTITDDLRLMLSREGAAMVGFGDLSELAPDARRHMPVGISVAVALNPSIIEAISEGPTLDYWYEYERANVLLDSLGQKAASLIQERGFQAIPLFRKEMNWDREQYRTVLPYKTVATRAGLGWIGKCALLVTRPFGAMIRLTTVLTDAPCRLDAPVNQSLCGKCTICVDKCPGKAVSGVEWTPGMPRESLFDARACAESCDKLCQPVGITETICGRCIRLCPWTERYLKSTGAIGGKDHERP